jgi:tetratricopeptide (TPR) repeat protein
MALFGFGAPASAAWYEASSDHFVIYADDSESDVREFSQNLERYHSALEYVTGREVAKPSPSNRLVIFVVGNQSDIRRLAGTNSRSIAGFYVPRAGASRAFVQNIQMKSGYPSFSTTVLLHEYAHHFLIASSSYAMPRWWSEGSAEFFAAATFNGDGSVQVGRPAQHRAGELAFADAVPIRELLDSGLYDSRERSRYDAFYGRSWLLYHFLTFEESRQGQLGEYGRRMAAGDTSLEAANAAFGDLDDLERELDRYLKRRSLYNLKLPAERIAIGEVRLRELPKGEAQMMDVRIRSQRGVDRETALEVLEDARKIARRYPDDPGVQTALAEAEFDAGNDAEAIAAADRAIVLDPNRPNAYVQKGFALFRMAETAPDPDAAYERAMVPFSSLNAIENDHPLPLIYYYRSFAERNARPNETARQALVWASELAPFDHQLALNAAVMHAGFGEIEQAKRKLAPIAANPHGGAVTNSARMLMGLFEAADEGVPFDAREISDGMSIVDGDDGDENEGGEKEGDEAAE